MITIGLKNMNRTLDYLDEILPDARCELNYNKDYEFLIAVMLSAQTTDRRVNEVTAILFNKYKTLKDLNDADIKDIERIIYPLGTYTRKAINVKDIASKLSKIGYVPNDRKYLEKLSGVGRKTINVVLAELYNEPCMAVDTHVSRISKRLKFANENDDVDVIERKITKLIPKERINRAHHQFVLFGRYYCKAKNPLCESCELKEFCRYKKRN